MKSRFAHYIRLYVVGFIMGAADIVPGVSGGTMAFILGVYNELLDAIRRFCSPEAVKMAVSLQFRKAFTTLPWPFLAALGAGILTSIAIFSTPIKWMLENRLSYILAFFFGLVGASIVSVCKRVEKWNAKTIAGLIAGTAAGWLVVGLSAVQSPPESLWYLMFCGAVAICAMILPGISGSFILLLLGRYELVLDAVHHLKSGSDAVNSIVILAVFAIGVVLGIGSFVRLLSWTLKRFQDVTISVLIGFMAGSLRKVWPWKVDADLNKANIMPVEFNREVIFAVILAAAGLVLVFAIEYIAARCEQKLGKSAGEDGSR